MTTFMSYFLSLFFFSAPLFCNVVEEIHERIGLAYMSIFYLDGEESDILDYHYLKGRIDAYEDCLYIISLD